MVENKLNNSSASQLIGDVLKNDMRYFYDNPGRESIEKICNSLILALSKKDYLVIVPCYPNCVTNDIFIPLTLEHNQLGENYKAYTGLDGYGLDNGSILMEISVLSFFKYIVKNSLSDLVLDHKCGHKMSVVLGGEDISRILYRVHLLKRAQTTKNKPVIDEEFLFAEKGLIYDNISLAIKNNIAEHTTETHTALCLQLGYAILYNVSFRMAKDHLSQCDAYVVHQHEQVGPVYMMFTNIESAVYCSDYPSRFAKIRTIFDRVLADDVNGLILDDSTFLNKESIKNIVDFGYEQIELQPADIKKIILNKI